MDCPQCRGYQLEPLELEPGLVVAGCTKCEGVLLSLMNYRYWVDQQADVVEAEDADLKEGLITEDSSQAKQCPKCSRLMTRFLIGEGSANRLELCGSCDEAWLDKGEWRLLKALDLQNRLPKIFTDAWQRNVRLQRRAQSLELHYQELLGAEDFKRANEFKRWVDGHPEKSHIRQYLISLVK